MLVVIHTADLQVLLIERAAAPGFWQSVTGSLDREDEALAVTAAREVAEETGIDLVYTVGEDIEELDMALPPARRGGHADQASEAAVLLTEAVRPGDVVLVKGSHATGMAVVTRALAALAIGNHRPGRSGI